MAMQNETIFDLSYDDLKLKLSEWNEKPFHANQLFKWIYRERVTSFAQMTDLSKGLREKLEAAYSLSLLTLVSEQQSKDGTRKYLFACQDGATIETVLMRHDYGYSVCVTSQIGCNMGCAFCASGLLKKQRNLQAGEIVGQILEVQRRLDQEKLRIANIVVMGIGEPFDNYDNVMKFVRIVNSDLGLAIGARHITISTCGVVDKIRQFAREKTQVNLAISLHAPTDALRSSLMPINRAYPLKQLMSALDEYSTLNNRKLTFEYILLSGVNDSEADAKALIDLVKGRNAYINLIPYNPVAEMGFAKTSVKSALRFYDLLMQAKVKATLRHEHGSDISAACGQLRAQHEGRLGK